MAVLDLGNAVAIAAFHPAGSYTATRNGEAVDTANFAYAAIVINCGTLGAGANVVTFHVEHSETSGGVYTACKQLNSTDDASLGPYRDTNAGDEMRLIRVDLNNTKRFLRVRVEHGGATALFYSVSAVLMPYQTDAASPATGSASSPNIEI